MEVEEAITSNEVAASSTATAERSVGALEAVASTSRIATPTDEHLFDLLNNCEPMDEDDRNDAAAAAWHSQVPSAWVRPLSRDMDSQKENVSWMRCCLCLRLFIRTRVLFLCRLLTVGQNHCRTPTWRE